MKQKLMPYIEFEQDKEVDSPFFLQHWLSTIIKDEQAFEETIEKKFYGSFFIKEIFEAFVKIYQLAKSAVDHFYQNPEKLLMSTATLDPYYMGLIRGHYSEKDIFDLLVHQSAAFFPPPSWDSWTNSVYKLPKQKNNIINTSQSDDVTSEWMKQAEYIKNSYWTYLDMQRKSFKMAEVGLTHFSNGELKEAISFFSRAFILRKDKSDRIFWDAYFLELSRFFSRLCSIFANTFEVGIPQEKLFDCVFGKKFPNTRYVSSFRKSIAEAIFYYTYECVKEFSSFLNSEGIKYYYTHEDPPVEVNLLEKMEQISVKYSICIKDNPIIHFSTNIPIVKIAQMRCEDTSRSKIKLIFSKEHQVGYAFHTNQVNSFLYLLSQHSLVSDKDSGQVYREFSRITNVDLDRDPGKKKLLDICLNKEQFIFVDLENFFLDIKAAKVSLCEALKSTNINIVKLVWGIYFYKFYENPNIFLSHLLELNF